MMNNSLSGMLAALAGGRGDVLSIIDGARGRFAALGGVLVATASIAALSAGFAARMALGAPVVAALAIGVGWGLVILAIDRALMAGMASQPSMARNLALAAPRVVLALILGTVISTPVTLQIFHKETDTEIRAIQREAADKFKKDLDEDKRFTVIPDLEQKVADEKARVVSAGGSDPAVKDKQAAYDAAFAKFGDLQAAAQCELNGNCGTGRAGVGTAYDEAKAAADRQLSVVEAAKRDLDAAAAASATQAGTDLTKNQDDLAALKRDRDALQSEFDARNGDDTGLLIRLAALQRLSDHSALMGWAHALLWAMFTCIELLPVLVKLLMSTSASEYERVQKIWDGGAADVFENQTQAWQDAQRAQGEIAVDSAENDRDIARAGLQKKLEVAQAGFDREKAQEIGIIERTAEVQGKVVDAYLDVFERQTLAQAKDKLNEFTRQNGGNGAAALPAPQSPQNGHGTNNYVLAAQLPDGTVL